MSDKQARDTEEQAPVIGLAGKRKWGYKVSQVDDFLASAHDLYEREEPALTQEEIQQQSFDLEKNGYIIGRVDATLIRLERAVTDKQTQWDITHAGRAAWQNTTNDLALTLRPRYELTDGERFSAGEKKTPSYDKTQVDEIVDQAWARISAALGLATPAEEVKGSEEVDTARVANIIFTQRKGKRGYDEPSVDAYLNRVIQVLTRLESIDRVMGGEDEPIPARVATAQASPQGASETEASSFAPHDGVDDLSDLLGSDVASGATVSAAATSAATGAGTAAIAHSGGDAVPSALSFAPVASASAEPSEQIDFGQGQSQPQEPAPSSLASLVKKTPSESVPLSDAEKTSVDADSLPPSFAPTAREGRTAQGSQNPQNSPEPAEAQSPAASASTVSAPAAQFSTPEPAAASADSLTAFPAVPQTSGDSESIQNLRGTQFADEAPARSEVPLPAAEVSAQKQSSPAPLPAQGTPSTTPAATETPAAAPQKSGERGENPDDYFSTLLSSSTVQTNSFEIPNLTFPTVPAEKPDSDSQDEGSTH